MPTLDRPSERDHGGGSSGAAAMPPATIPDLVRSRYDSGLRGARLRSRKAVIAATGGTG